MLIQLFLFGTEYEVYCVINNQLMANRVLSNFVPDIILIQASMLCKTLQNTLNLSKLQPKNIILLVGEQEEAKDIESIYKLIKNPFDKNDLFQILDEVEL